MGHEGEELILNQKRGTDRETETEGVCTSSWVSNRNALSGLMKAILDHDTNKWLQLLGGSGEWVNDTVDKLDPGSLLYPFVAFHVE